jgi:putative FmdB family regulatory protein
MPLYEYECTACGHRFERIQKFSDPPVETCPSCAGTVRKLLSSPAIQFKGSGWYITDYARKGSSGSSPSTTSPEKKSESDSTTGSSSSSASGTSSTSETKAPSSS